MSEEKKFVSINYTSRDFNSLRSDLMAYAKRYYPDTVKDFTEASFGSLMFDTVAYVGDILSFYLDYQFNESLLAGTNDYNNAVRLAKQIGYKFPGSTSAFGEVAFYAKVPANTVGLGPNTDYMPILRANTVVGASNGVSFILTEDVRFDNPNNEVVAADINNTTGIPSSYAVKAFGNVVSGQFETITVKIGTFEKYKKVTLSDNTITEIISVFDSNGNEYFEVDYLSQDVIYQSEVNVDPSTKEQSPAIIIPKSAPRRFIVDKNRDTCTLTFGHGSEDSITSNLVPDPSEVAIERFGRTYVTDETFDPTNLIKNNTFGVAPANTTLIITVRKNTSLSTNVGVGAVSSVTNAIVDFNDISRVPAATRNQIRADIEAYNEQPISSTGFLPSLADLKTTAMGAFAAQGRAVTPEDYEAFLYHMPAKFGSVKRVRAVRDADSLKRNINLYVLSSNAVGRFALSNTVSKANMKRWITRYKMMNDTVDILDGRIINIGIDFDIVAGDQYNKYEVLNDALRRIRRKYRTAMFIGEPINIYDVYAELSQVDGVVDVVSVKFNNKTGGNYSSDALNLKRYTTPDGRRIIPPENAAFEIKFPLTDINGAIR